MGTGAHSWFLRLGPQMSVRVGVTVARARRSPRRLTGSARATRRVHSRRLRRIAQNDLGVGASAATARRMPALLPPGCRAGNSSSAPPRISLTREGAHATPTAGDDPTARPTQSPTSPTASRTGRRRPGIPPRRIGQPRSPPGPNDREPRLTAPNEHQVWEQNVDNISCPTTPCSQFAPTTAHNRRIVDHQKIHYSRPVPALNCGYSSEADGVTRVELRGFEPLTL
jgi:hypothetical protein